ncbi:potassium-transporting ATPase subunit C [Streptomyces sp. BRA346]|uniref:potassium-transporting ATPase subunit C n=1 Tax=Streptomyces sp. BRA346 TaxID=2878199 RepID=UPI004064B193
MKRHGRTIGSSLLGQNFTLPARRPGDPHEAPRPDPKWFQPRPSAGYDPLASGASNLGPNNPELVRTVKRRKAVIAAFDGAAPGEIPVDAVTASGLDPHISPDYAYQQVNRVAKARGLRPATVTHLVTDHVRGRVLGFLGQECVDVVELDSALADHTGE